MKFLSLPRLLTLLVCAWTGAVLAIAFIAAPAAFQTLPSKELAGSVAAQLFKVEAYGTLLVAAFAWIALRPNVEIEAAIEEITIEGERKKAIIPWPLWTCLLLILMATILGYFGLTPQMQEIKTAAGSASAEYTKLHGMSMMLYAIKTLAWCVLSVLLMKRV